MNNAFTPNAPRSASRLGAAPARQGARYIDINAPLNGGAAATPLPASTVKSGSNWGPVLGGAAALTVVGLIGLQALPRSGDAVVAQTLPAPAATPAAEAPEALAQAEAPAAAEPAPAVVAAAPAAAPAVVTPVAPAAPAVVATARQPEPAPVTRVLTPTPAPAVPVAVVTPREPTPAELIATAPTAAGSVPTPAAAPALAEAPAASAPAVAATAPEPVVVSDQRITATVKTALAGDAALAAAPISVSTERGIVKLEGQAPDAPARDRATALAAAPSGVRGVDNRLVLPVAVGAAKAPVVASL